MDSLTTTAPEVSRPTNAAGVKHKGEGKTARIPIKVVAAPMLRKPDWIRVKAPTGEAAARFTEIK